MSNLFSHKHKRDDEYAFTLIEILVVILIIGVLAAIAIPAFLNQRQRANEASAKSDLRQIQHALTLAKVDTGRTALQITANQYTANPCISVPYLETLPKNHNCWIAYDRAMQRISDASGIDVTGLTDPYGRPYFLDENEGENGGCNKDVIGYYKYPVPEGSVSKVSFTIQIDHVTAACGA